MKEADSMNNSYAFPDHKSGFYEKYIKRLLDFVITSIALLLLSPVFLFVAIAVRINLGKPILFRQKRIGRNEKSFTMMKFRSMKDGIDKNGRFLPDTERLTKFGRILRATSLDELPELVNIWQGKMSLIGPRPLPVEYLPYFRQEERLRHAVRGGLTGLAQVKGRNAIGWDERFQIDIEYVEHISFWKDVMIFMSTFKKALSHSDIGERGLSAPEDLDLSRSKQEWYLIKSDSGNP